MNAASTPEELGRDSGPRGQSGNPVLWWGAFGGIAATICGAIAVAPVTSMGAIAGYLGVTLASDAIANKFIRQAALSAAIVAAPGAAVDFAMGNFGACFRDQAVPVVCTPDMPGTKFSARTGSLGSSNTYVCK